MVVRRGGEGGLLGALSGSGSQSGCIRVGCEEKAWRLERGGEIAIIVRRDVLGVPLRRGCFVPREGTGHLSMVHVDVTWYSEL